MTLEMKIGGIEVRWSADRDQEYEVLDRHSPSTRFHSDGLVVKHSRGKGLGVFAAHDFKEGEFVEVCPIFYFTEKESFVIKQTDIGRFTYTSGSRSQLSVWAAGYANFYNHSLKPNVNPFASLDDMEHDHYLATRALRDIKKGEELVFDYTGGEGGDMGFRVIE